MPAGPAAGPPQTEARPFPHRGAGVTRMAKASERQITLGRRTARVCSIDGRCIAAEVLENPLNHGRILDAGDHPQLPAATSANLYVDGEHALEALRPGHRPLSVAGPASLAIKSSGSKITCVVPSRYGVFSAQRTSPPSVSDNRSVATGGLAT